VTVLPDKLNNPEFMKKYVSIVPEEFNRLQSMLNNVSDYSKWAKPFNPVSCNIPQTIDKILFITEYECAKNNITVIKKYDENLSEIVVDIDQIKQVFMNIIINAIQSMQDGGKLTINCTETDNYMNIRFVDTGMGINPQIIDKLCTGFYTSKETGTGLGLFISNKIIREHEGILDITSNSDSGTTLTIRLPMHNQPNNQ
jgi:signal transduction histidine kinase